MQCRSTEVVVLALGALCGIGGCTINDPNHNSKVLYSMVMIHADKTLKAAGSELTHMDYDKMRFSRSSHDPAIGKRCSYYLYDFLKSTNAPGPQRFVVAYNHWTRTTSLRSDLRSDINLERLPDW